MNLLDLTQKPPKNKHLLGAIAVAALINTLICLGLLFSENANKRTARALQVRLESLERDDSLARDLARLSQAMRHASDGIAGLEASKADAPAIEALRFEIAACRTELEALFKKDLADVKSELTKARKAEQP